MIYGGLGVRRFAAATNAVKQQFLFHSSTDGTSDVSMSPFFLKYGLGRVDVSLHRRLSRKSSSN